MNRLVEIIQLKGATDKIHRPTLTYNKELDITTAGLLRYGSDWKLPRGLRTS
jgi:hypothetical protein